MGATSMLAMSSAALAQESAQDGTAAEETAPPEILVTGSRIVRRDFEANSPIITVDDALLQSSATASIETNLNKLPQFTPAKTPNLGGDIQPTAQNTPGSATISLRGIGANRNLVLLDGRRATPSNASQVVDINTIPSAAIERVEIISGGASSTYGADAVGGVVNFILRKNFQGLELDGQAGVTEEGDNFEYELSGLMGANFDDGRGNITLAFSTNTREKSRQRDRQWYRDLWADPSIGGSQFFPPFGGFNTGFSNLPSPTVLNAVIDGASFTSGPGGAVIYSDFAGNAFAGFDTAGRPGATGFTGNIDGFRYKLLDSGSLGVNDVDALLILPLTRYNMYARGNYEITDWIGVFAQGYFSQAQTRTQTQPAVLSGGLSVRLDPTINRDVIPDELLAILDSRANPSAAFELRAYLPFPRSSQTDVYTYNMTVGLEGRIPGTDWTWEAYVQRGESETSVFQTGFASLERYRAIITQPNFGQGFSAKGNADFGGFGASSATCTSGLNLFAPSTITPDCFDAIGADIKTRSVMVQSIWEANLQGKLADLPAGELRASFGASHRDNDYAFENDTLTTQGTSFLDQAVGLQPSGNSAGAIQVKEIYGELLVPVIGDLPLVRQFNIELGVRYSDYSTTGGSWTYKLLGDWSVTPWLRLRGGFNRAERAPNIAELYLAPETIFASAGGGDVCSTRNKLSYSANPDTNADYQQAIAMCGQLMEASGEPTADDSYYGVDYRLLTTASPEDVRSLVTTNQASGAATVFPMLRGNPNLKPEVADTWTAGAVIRSPWDNPLLNDLRLSIDYYNIKVSDAIGAQSVDIVQRQCFDPAFNPSHDADSALCAGVDRNQTGALGNVVRTFLNNGRFETSGIDVQLNWAFDLGPGRLSLNSVLNYLINIKVAELPTDPLVDYAGSQGPTINGLQGSSYRYKLLSTVGYRLGGAYLSLQWRHLPSIKSATQIQVPTATQVGVAESYNLFALHGSYALTANAVVRFGIENLLNARPPLSGYDPAAVLPALPGGGFDSQNYDVNGRRFYLGAKLKF
jgi:outer membrane receptor protein involved in Fe transport